MNQPEKKRLRLMPEVLPAPARAKSNGPSARERTLSRLKVLTAISAAGFASIAAACRGSVASTDGTGADGGLDAGEDGPKPGCDPYCVVDPLPRPTCFDKSEGVSQKLTATAHYGTSADGGTDASIDDAGADGGTDEKAFEVTVTFESPVQNLVLSTTTASDPSLIAIDDTELTTTSLTLKAHLKRAPSGTSQTINVQLSCAKGPTYLQVQLRFGEDDAIEAEAYAN